MPKCRSGKIGYRSEIEALLQRDRKSQWYQTEMRAYRCPDCRRFHLARKNPPKRST